MGRLSQPSPVCDGAEGNELCVIGYHYTRMSGSDLTLTPFLQRAARLYPETELVTRTDDGVHRYTYADYAARTAQLAHALDDHGVERRDRLATVCFNHYRHFEIYFGVPGIGAQYHTVNPFLPDHHVDYIVDDAEDRWVFVDAPVVEQLEGALADETADAVEQFVVVGDEVPATSLEPITTYETLIEGYPTDYDWPDVDEDLPAGMCYTSGTTGRPKGVEYTHKMLWAHVMASLTPQGYHVDDRETVMSGVPMFHVNAVDSPFFSAAAGAKQVFAGRSPDPEDYVELLVEEGVTLFFAVPAICLGIIEHVEEHDVDLSTFDRIQIGADSVSKSLVDRFEARGVEVIHGWGATEALPLTTASHPKPEMETWSASRRREKQMKIGLPLPGVECRVVDEDGDPVPWDGESLGELHVRGPWITTEYHGRPDATESGFEDGWFLTGDVVTVDPDGFMDLVDRETYLIKSGGEWISSMELETAIEGHSAVESAVVVGVDDERWGQRPVAYVIPADGDTTDDRAESLTPLLEAHVEEEFPAWWVPDEFVYVGEIPRTATGKADKQTLARRYEA